MVLWGNCLVSCDLYLYEWSSSGVNFSFTKMLIDEWIRYKRFYDLIIRITSPSSVTPYRNNYKPYWNYTVHLRSHDQQIQQARIINLFKRGFEEKKEGLGWKFRENLLVYSKQIANVAPSAVLYRFRGVTTMTITIGPSWNFPCKI